MYKDLVHIHPEPGNAPHLTRQHRFRAWVFLNNLCVHGPEYFRQFKSLIQEPETLEQIPLTKTPILTTRAMDVDNSTMSGNIQAVIGPLGQEGGLQSFCWLSPCGCRLSWHLGSCHSVPWWSWNRRATSGSPAKAINRINSLESFPTCCIHTWFIPSEDGLCGCSMALLPATPDGKRGRVKSYAWHHTALA